MSLKGKKIGFGLTGSHCTLDKVLIQVARLVEEGAEVFPIITPAIDHTNTRFGEAIEWKKRLATITGQKLINSITAAEPIGPGELLDVLLIAPCTGNTLAKLANGITDTAVLMAAKAQLRNQKPIVIAISTNDGLGLNAKNVATLLNSKNIYMVPFGQDDPHKKSNSLVAKVDLIIPAIEAALQGKQLQPILICPEIREN